MSTVIVAVRIRPLTQQETENNTLSTLKLENNTISVVSTSSDSRLGKNFTFDHVYSNKSDDLVNGSYELANELYPSPQSTTDLVQQTIFNDIGLDLLAHAFAGFNATIMAYGQTGSGTNSHDSSLIF